MYLWLKVFAILLEEKKKKCLREGLITNSYPSKSQDGKGISEFACSLVLSMGVSPSPLYTAETSGGWTGSILRTLYLGVTSARRKENTGEAPERATGIKGGVNPWGSQEAEVLEMGPEGGQRGTDWQGETHEGT